MSNKMKINDLTARRLEIERGGGEAAIKKIHAQNGLTARERISQLLDSNSFVEVGAFVKPRVTDFNMSEVEAPADGVVTGYGAIKGRLVYVYSQDRTVLGGAVGEMHARKIVHIYDMALKMGAPVVALLDSSGIRLQESLDALHGFGRIFLKQSRLSGVVPQITAVLGSCGGGATIIPSLSDFTFMTKENSAMYVNSANALDAKVEMKDISTADFHAETTGLIDFVYDTEEEIFENIRKLMTFLPQNNQEEALHIDISDQPNRMCPELSEDNVSAITIIEELTDHGDYLEIGENYAKDIVAAFGRMNGMPVGLVGNRGDDTYLTLQGAEKMKNFVFLCDAYNIPIITLTNVKGFEPSFEAEKAGMSKRLAKLTYALSNTTSPRVSIIYGEAYGSAYVAQNSKHIGADMVYAWPNAKIATMTAEAAVRIMYAKEIEAATVSTEYIAEQVAIYEANEASPYTAASRGYVDNIIEPAATRKRVIAALEMLYTKKEMDTDKKHGTV